jgi:hypothetical protein
MEAQFSTPWAALLQTQHHLQLHRLHAPVAAFASLHASIPKQHSPRGGDVGTSQQSSFTLVPGSENLAVYPINVKNSIAVRDSITPG